MTNNDNSNHSIYLVCPAGRPIVIYDPCVDPKNTDKIGSETLARKEVFAALLGGRISTQHLNDIYYNIAEARARYLLNGHTSHPTH